MLKISAFGPYADETILDFSELGMQHLFVITGPTGAGKTTIFEAIYYALYGELSKQGNGIESVRSDFLSLEDKILTYVSFTFEVNGKQYSVYRQPPQMVMRSNNKGLREETTKCTLACVNHDQFLPLSRVNEINEKIKEIIGLDKRQFKQIMMLPQGAFQEFLISNTKEKKELLRHIFNTTLYERAQKRIAEKKNELFAEHETMKKIFQTQAESLHFRNHLIENAMMSDAALQEIINYQAIEYDYMHQLKETLVEADRTFQEATVLLNEKMVHNERLEQWRAGIQQYEELLSHKDEIELLKQRLKYVEQVHFVLSHEENLQEEKNSYQKKLERYQKVEQTVKVLINEYEILSEKYDTYIQQTDMMETFYEKTKENERRLSALKQLKQFHQMIEKYEQQLAHQIEVVEKIMIEIQQQTDRRLQLEAQQKKYMELAIEKEQLSQIIVTKNQVLERYLETYKMAELYGRHLDEFENLKKQLNEAVETLKITEKQFDDLKLQEQLYQASYLAENLHDGVPCPVCGALHHPKLAEGITAFDLNKLEQAEKSKQNALKSVSAIEATCLERERQLEIEREQLLLKGYLGTTQEELNCYLGDIKRQGMEARKTVDVTQKRFDELVFQLNQKDALEKQLNEVVQCIRDKEEKNRALNQERENCRVLLETTRQKWQSICQQHDLSGEESIEKLELENNILKDKVVTYQKEKESCRSRQEIINHDKIKNETMLKELQEQLQIQKNDIRIKSDRLEQLIVTSFHHKMHYETAKEDLKKQAHIRDEILHYDTHWQKVIAQNEILDRQLLSKEPVCIETYQKQYDASKAHVDEVRDAYSKQQLWCQENDKLIHQLEDMVSRFKTLEKLYEVVGMLSNVLNGNNEYKTGFETYVQAYYFEKVLQCANHRLGKMTQGRYYFMRQEAYRDGRRQAGLEIDVMDQYTGKPRAVTTLSGGESFKASLALALGLADVVSAENGGVELSTIFIDEGFGTLDDESLDSTIEALIQLQESGRLVGVISHVAELKERIHARIVVETVEKGSRAHFEVKK